MNVQLYQALLLMAAGEALAIDLPRLTCFRGGAAFWEDVREAMNKIIAAHGHEDTPLDYLLNFGEELEDTGDMISIFADIDIDTMAGRTIRVLGIKGYFARKESFPFLAKVIRGFNQEVIASALESKGDVSKGQQYVFEPFQYSTRGNVGIKRTPDWEFVR